MTRRRNPACTLLLLPGLHGTGRLFDPIVAAMPPHVATEVVAYPCERFLDYAALELQVRGAWPEAERVVVVAESFSGPIGVALGADPPPGMAALVLVASFVRSPIAYVPPLVAEWIGRLAFAIGPQRLAMRRLLTGGDGELAKWAQAEVAEVPSQVLAKRLRAALQVDVRQRLASCSLPVLYLRATRDRLVTVRAAELVAATAPEARHVDVDAPHLLLQAAPEAAADAILELIATLD